MGEKAQEKQEGKQERPTSEVCLQRQMADALSVYQGTFARGPREPSIYLTLGGKTLWLVTAAVRGPAGRGTCVLDCCVSLSAFDLESLWADVRCYRNCTQTAPPIPAPVQEMQPSGEGLHGRNNGWEKSSLPHTLATNNPQQIVSLSDFETQE